MKSFVGTNALPWLERRSFLGISNNNLIALCACLAALAIAWYCIDLNFAFGQH